MILVTGATGFVGSRLLNRLAASRDEPSSLRKYSPTRCSTLAAPSRLAASLLAFLC